MFMIIVGLGDRWRNQTSAYQESNAGAGAVATLMISSVSVLLIPAAGCDSVDAPAVLADQIVET